MSNIKKAISHLPITQKTNENDPPDPIQCTVCGEDRKTLYIDIPLVGKRWVHAACECAEKERKKWEDEQNRREKNRNIQKILRLSSSIEALKAYTWENLRVRQGMEVAVEEVKNAVEEFEQRGSIGLHIFGASGAGKTHITAAGANELLKKGYSVIFLTEKDLFSRFKESHYYENEERFFEIMNACLQADLLVWDDLLSSQRLTNQEKDWIFQVVNGRERAKKPIWYTSNLTDQDVAKSKYQYVLDDAGRTWGRIVANSKSIFNRATNYRLIQSKAITKGVPIEQIEDIPCRKK